MKIRSDYVTNSSSSSFIIAKRCLDDEQIKAIRNHSKLGEKLGMEYSDWEWEIEENENYITGFAMMDNFDMQDFLMRIDVSCNAVNWSENRFNLPEESVTDKKDSEWRKLLNED